MGEQREGPEVQGPVRCKAASESCPRGDDERQLYPKPSPLTGTRVEGGRVENHGLLLGLSGNYARSCLQLERSRQCIRGDEAWAHYGWSSRPWAWGGVSLETWGCRAD